MEKIITTIILLLICGNAYSMQTDDLDRICISAVVQNDNTLSVESEKLLYNKLQEIITANGFTDNDYVTRFMLAARVNILNKDIIVGPPQKVSQTIEVTLFIGDVECDKAFDSYSFEITGIGTNVNKSFINAIKQIKPRSQQYVDFMAKGKQSILNYYTIHSSELIALAKQLAASEDYRDALDILTSIPNVNAYIYSQCGNLIEDYYFKMIEADGNYYFNAAKSAWAANPTKEGASIATEYLSQINFNASIQPQASNLAESITEQMKKIDEREWEQHLQEYKDGIEREKRQWEQRMQQERQAHKRGMARDAQNAATHRVLIRAYRDIAVERAKNQPKVINFNRINIW